MIPAVALAVGGAGAFLAGPAYAGPAPLPTPGTTVHADGATQSQLRARVTGALTTDHPSTREQLSSSTTGTTGTVDPKIIGGVTTDISTAPWMAQLWYYDDRGTADTSDDIGFFCGGTVVSPSKILTASHCVKGYDWYKNGAIITGTDQLPTTDANGNTDFHGGTITAVWRQWNHPSYNATTVDNDIALLTLDGAVAAKPLPITTSNDTASYTEGTSATVYGWGRTSSTTQDISQTLQKASLPINSNTTCSAAYGADFIAGHMLCAGTPATGSDTGTVTPCNGDSGGPLVVNGKIVGVVSWGVQDCVAAGAYSVFTKVSTYVGAVNPRMDDANLSADDKADLFTRTPGGTAYVYRSLGTSLAGRQSISGAWGSRNLVRQADLNRDDFQDFVVRTTGGDLYWLSGTGTSLRIGGGWGVMRSITLPGDVNGDALPDLVAQDTSGVLWLYPGNGKGYFGTRTKVGSGWGIYSGNVYGKGDLTGDGKADMVARDGYGYLWLYKGTGSAAYPFAGRVKIGGGWSYNAYAATGDTTGDGRADLITRDGYGYLWLYKGTGSATAPYAPRVKIGTGFGIYNLFG